MTETKHKGKTLSFWQFLKNNKIEIPIIQRDYAQGREDKKEIRENFLNAIQTSLVELKPIQLDFIYGSIEGDSMLPLDGQQRLTTLFLLHWYAAAKTNEDLSESKSVLSRFTYETRISSREFCTALVESTILIAEGGSIRQQIVNSSWFVLSWEKDPTIDAMLRTIDDIHSKFFVVNDLWSKLITEKCLISFYHVELKNIGLTDDLYIKMNARGKLLSPFENFKASFQKYTNDRNWEEDIDFFESFACQIDTSWTDLFWSHRKDDSIDEAFMRFASAVAMIRQSVERTENRINTIAILQDRPNALKPEHFSEEGFKYLKSCFNVYSSDKVNSYDLSLDFMLWQHRPIENIFSALVYEDNALQKGSASYTQKILFFAQTEYLKRVQQFNQDNFKDWMRVIRNIVSRGDVTKYGDRPAIIRSMQTFDGMVNLVSELAEGCENIIAFLYDLKSTKSLFAKDQLEEEILKARIISENDEVKKIITNLEDNNLLRGRLAFPFFCLDLDRNSPSVDVSALKKIEHVFSTYFNSEGDLPNSLRRALLTIGENGNHEYYSYWWSFWNVVSATKRCLIDKYRELEYFIYSSHRSYFKSLVLLLTTQNLEEIIKAFAPPATMPNWKIRLIKESNLLDDYCKSNYIAIPEDNSCCYLLKSMRPRDITGCEKIQ